MANSNLTEAKRAKNDELYNQYPDIEYKMVGSTRLSERKTPTRKASTTG